MAAALASSKRRSSRSTARAGACATSGSQADVAQALDRDALFFHIGWRLRTDLARALSCELRDDRSIVVDAAQATSVDRVYAAGNCTDPRALVPTAAGTGVAAAVAVNARLTVEDADRAVAASAQPQSAPQVH